MKFKFALVATMLIALVVSVTYGNPEPGSLKWEFCTCGAVWSSPAIGSDGTIYFGRYSGGWGDLYALNRDGSLKWIFETAGDVKTSPAIGSDGTVYFGSEDDNLYALTPNGSLKWKYECEPGCSVTMDVYSSPAIGDDGTIYFGSNNCYLHALNPDGSLKWRFGTSWIIQGSPAIGSDGTVYFGRGYDGCLYAVWTDSGGLADSPWPMFHHDVRHSCRVGGP